MLFPDGRRMVWADCAVNVSPTAEDLADIARASTASCEVLLGPARVAMLSFSTGTSGQGDSVERVRAASELSGFMGPVQADAALNPRIAEKKGLGDGDANVPIFPDLDSGNIGYKLAQELAGAQALGPFLQGFRTWWLDAYFLGFSFLAEEECYLLLMPFFFWNIDEHLCTIVPNRWKSMRIVVLSCFLIENR